MNSNSERKRSFMEGGNKENNKKITKEDILENIEINENVELEYEIKLPKFLIDYSEKTNKDINLDEKMNAISLEKDDNESDESDEKDLLLNQEKNKTSAPGIVPTPGERKM